MANFFLELKNEPWILISVVILQVISLIVLRSIAPEVFPNYYFYLAGGFIVFIFFSKLDYKVLRAFSLHLYLGSVLFLLLPLIIGQVTRGAVRWIPLGALTVQPAEIVRPFLILFFATYLTQGELNLQKATKATVMFLIPALLIMIQPSLGVAILTSLGFLGVLLALKFNKKILAGGALLGLASLPLFWQIMQPYQKVRITTLFNADADPTGVGFNSIQSKISVGSGELFGRGLGEGVQTQLFFLPEKHTDFIFASISEEMGFFGATLVVLASFYLLYRIASSVDNSVDFTARAFMSGAFLTLFGQTMIHIGMNMGLFPITGLPLPLVSAGGSSLIGIMIVLGMVVQIKHRNARLA